MKSKIELTPAPPTSIRKESFDTRRKELLKDWRSRRPPRGPGKKLAGKFLRGERLTRAEAIIAHGYMCSGENDMDCDCVCPLSAFCPYHVNCPLYIRNKVKE